MSFLTQEMKRHAVLVALHAEHSDLEIANFLKVSRQFVYKVRNELVGASGDVNLVSTRKSHSPRSGAIRSPEFVEEVQKIIDDDPGKSMRAIAKSLSVSESTVRRIVHKDIVYKSYKLRKGQLLNAKAKENRVIKGRRLLNLLKHPSEPNILWIFSDEKNFSQDRKVNTQNDRWLCDEPSKVPTINQTKFPSSVMVLGVVSHEGHIMPPHFFPQGLRVCAKDYIDVLETVVLPWIKQIAQGRPFIFQQDSAPSHTAGITQEWMSNNFHDFVGPNVWPPNSPDLNPLDYYVWGVVERDANKCPHNTKESLREAIHESMVNMDQHHLTSACARFRSRIEAVIEADGGFIR